MSKTLVTAEHVHGPLQNGEEGCFARAAHNGMCPGVANAIWLNNLGDDDEIYVKGNPRIHGSFDITVGHVRMNWLRANMHVVPLEPKRAELLAAKNRAAAELRRVNRQLKELETKNNTRTDADVEDDMRAVREEEL